MKNKFDASAVNSSSESHFLKDTGLDEQTIRFVLSKMPVGIALLRDRKIIWCNSRMESWLGYSRDELIGKTPAFLYPDQQEYLRVDRELYDGLRENEIRETETRNIHKDGTLIDLAVHSSLPDSSISPPIYLCTISDISEQKKTQQRLNSEIDLIKTLFKASSAFIVVISAKDGTVAMINESMLEALGYTREQVLGKQYLELFAPGDEWQSISAVFQKLVNAQEPSINESHVLTKDGRHYLVEWHGRPVLAQDESLDYFLGVGVDITERNRFEAALRESEEKYRGLFEKAADATAIIDGGCFTDCNSSTLELLGLQSKSEMIGKAPWKFSPKFQPDGKLSIEKADEILDRTYREGRVLFEWEHIRPDGTIVPVEVVLTMIPVGGKKVIYAIWRDLSARKKTEADLRESEDRYRGLFEKASDATSILEGKRFIDCNKSTLDVLNYKKKTDIIGKAPWEFSPEVQPDGRNSREKAKEIIERTYQDGHALFEWEHMGLDGRIIPCEVMLTLIPVGSRQLIYVVWRDLSARKKAEAELRESEETFRALAENSFDGIMRFDRAKRHLYVNPAVEKFVDIPWREFIGKTHEELGFPAKLVEICEKAIEQVFLTGKTNRLELQLPNDIWVDWVLIPEFDEKGKVKAVMTSSRDLTDRKRDEVEKAKLEEQLRQLQKMESIGMLAGGVAHDFNNMLTPILGYTEIALMDLDKNSPLYKEIEEIHRAAERASALTRQLLAFGRKQVLDLRVINLNNTVHDFSRMIKRLIGEDVELAIRVDPKLGNVKADTDQVQQILMNLAVNSRVAMPEGGVLSILTVNTELDQQYCNTHPQVNPGQFVMLAVSDNGRGMDKKTRSHIFEPFFTTKERDKGSGLGLSTVYGIVRQHGGHITVYSEPGEGTTFKVFLPRVDIIEQKLTADSTHASTFTGTETILVAEDEEVVRKLASHVLRENGYTVIEAASGEQALQTVKNQKFKIQLLLSDVIMPGMNGRELYRQLARLYPDLKVLYTSGYTDDVIAEHGVLDEGIHFLQKPFTVKSILTKVRETLDA